MVARDAPNFTVVVDADGTLNRGHAVMNASRLATGQYQVFFERSVANCAYTANIGLSSFAGTTTPGMITVSPVPRHARAVTVDTYDLTGNPMDSGFHLIVAC